MNDESKGPAHECTEDHHQAVAQIKRANLPKSQRTAFRHLCPGCAFDLGYELGRIVGYYRQRVVSISHRSAVRLGRDAAFYQDREQWLLARDIRDDDAQPLIDAIKQLRQLRHVIGVEGNVGDAFVHVAEMRIRRELRQKLWEVLKE